MTVAYVEARDDYGWLRSLEEDGRFGAKLWPVASGLNVTRDLLDSILELAWLKEMLDFGVDDTLHLLAGLFWLTYAIPVLHVAVISGRVWDWPAGPAWGPRLLSPMLPLLALPCAYGLSRFPRLGLPLAVYSILVTSVATLTDACPPYDVHLNPLLELNLPALLKAELSPNLGTLLGIPAHLSVVLFYGVLVVRGTWLWRSLKLLEVQVEAGPRIQSTTDSDERALVSSSADKRRAAPQMALMVTDIDGSRSVHGSDPRYVRGVSVRFLIESAMDPE